MRRAAKKAVATRYPVLSLYRDILRAHQKYLPTDARELGDSYVKAEFRLHANASDQFKVQFERTWRDYLTTLRVTDPERPDGIGREMTSDELGALNDEQKVQLLKIREETLGPPKVKT